MRWDGDNDVWLFNPEWEVIPTIVFEEGCPIFRICRHHNCREGKHMLHTPRRPHHILPAPCSDQLAHCIMKPRTVKQMQKKYCSNSYQMFQQYASKKHQNTVYHFVSMVFQVLRFSIILIVLSQGSEQVCNLFFHPLNCHTTRPKF